MVDADLGQLSPSQQEALQQYTQVTNQALEDAVPLLERSQWNVQIAIAKFFDGEGPDLLAEAVSAHAAHAAAVAAPGTEPLLAPRAENLQESLAASGAGHAGRLRRAPRSDPAPRIVPRKPETARLPWMLAAVLLAPFNVGWRVASAFVRTIVYILSYLPVSVRPTSLHAAMSPGLRSTAGRRMLMPRDTAARFRREFEEEYGSRELPWFEGGIAQAHDLAKRDLKFLLVVLVSPEHDDTESFTRDTLLSPEVVSFVRDPANNIVLWGGNVLDSEAYQVSQEYNCTKHPFSAVVCLTPKEGSTRMGIVKRLVGPAPPASYVGDIRSVIERYAGDLDGLRAQRTAQEVSRSLRNDQDDAYERSLARDRERARQRREAEAAAAEAERKARQEAEAARMLEDQRQQWRRWRAARVLPEPSAGEPGLVRLALKLPEALSSAGRVVRRFRADAKMEELYAFVECCDLLLQGPLQEPLQEPLDEEAAARPQGYKHDFRFRIASVMPRVVLHPSDTETIGATVGKSGNLIVEFLDDDDEAYAA